MPKFDIYWSPEGRMIATVEAKTAKAAKRMAPMPYRKFLGEIYTEVHTNSYTATVTLVAQQVGEESSTTDGCLLGGQRSHTSSAFVNRVDAQSWAETCEQINRDRTGYQNAIFNVRINQVYDKNPIGPVN